MSQYDGVVIGAGPGGYVCAIKLAQLGMKTAIVEKENVGGVCLNVGCIPSKALIYASNQYWKAKNEFSEFGVQVDNVGVDITKMQEWKGDVVKKLTGGVGQLLKMNKVDQLKGTAKILSATSISVTGSDGKVSQISTKNIVVATGSRVLQIPTLPFNGKNIISSTDALDLKSLPKKLLVIGGGFIGIEIGTVYAKLGSEVTIVEAMDTLLSTVDQELVSVVERKMRKLGIRVLKGTKALGLTEKDPVKASVLHLEVETADKKKETLEATHILVAVGRKPNSDGIGLESVGVKLDPRGNILVDTHGKTNVPGIWAIGDITGAPQLAHRASMDGVIVASNISGDKSFKDYKTVPWAVFCDPEIAVSGLTEKEAVEKGFTPKIGKFPFAANGRALGTNETDGFVKVIVDEKTEAILGVHMVGPEVSNLIAEGALAIEMGACLEDLARTIHTHPTLAETLPEAAEAAFSKAIHIYKPTTADASRVQGSSLRPSR